MCSMNVKKLFLLIALTSVGAVLIVAGRLLIFESINPWNGNALCNAIQVGMDESEVNGILGRSADRELLVPEEKRWEGSNCAIFVYFDYQSMKVRHKYFVVIREDLCRHSGG